MKFCSTTECGLQTNKNFYHLKNERKSKKRDLRESFTRGLNVAKALRRVSARMTTLVITSLCDKCKTKIGRKSLFSSPVSSAQKERRTCPEGIITPSHALPNDINQTPSHVRPFQSCYFQAIFKEGGTGSPPNYGVKFVAQGPVGPREAMKNLFLSKKKPKKKRKNSSC